MKKRAQASYSVTQAVRDKPFYASCREENEELISKTRETWISSSAKHWGGDNNLEPIARGVRHWQIERTRFRNLSN